MPSRDSQLFQPVQLWIEKMSTMQFCSRKELFDIFFVNKRLGAATLSRALDNQTWEGGILTIVQESE